MEEIDEDAIALSYVTRARLQIKVCIRTYRLFFVPRTEDFFWRLRTPEEVEQTHELAVKRREQRKNALSSWLKTKVPAEGTRANESNTPAVIEAEMKESQTNQMVEAA